MAEAILVSLLVSVIYGVVFAQREDRIRAKLAATKHGWTRQLYVLAFVGAIRGKASASDTAILAYFAVLTVFAVSLLFYFVPVTLDDRARSLERTIEEYIGKLDGRPSMEPAVDVRHSDLQARATRLRGEMDRLLLITRILAWGGMVAGFVGWWFWRPFVVMRRRFAHELDRFTLRIQGLASKSELAQVALAEARVKDEATLRAFVALAAAVAKRQGVAELVITFDLWNGDSRVAPDNST